MWSNERGFTLVELMVTLALVVIILGLSLPNLGRIGNRFRLKGAANACSAALHQARMEAMKSAGSVAIVFQQPIDGISYDLVLFHDSNANSRLDGGERIIDRIRLSDTGAALQISNNTFELNGDDPSVRAVRFNARGFPLTSSDGFASGSVTIRDGASGHTIAIKLSLLGEIHVDPVS